MPNTVDVPHEVQLLLNYLPLWMQEAAKARLKDGLEELVIDLNRPLMLRFNSGYERSDQKITKDDMAYIRGRLSPFRSDNRTGINGTLHRISATKDRYGDITGMHVRIGQSIKGVAEPLTPLLQKMTRGFLMIGPPRVGKTTLLRDIVRILSSVIKVDPDQPEVLPNGVINHFGPSVVVVDNSNEIGGDGQESHPDIGDVTRLQVSDPSELARVLLEAIINKSPTHVIGDEIGSTADVQQVLTIAKRGAMMIATVHGFTLQNVLTNPVLLPLMGNPDNGKRRDPSVFDIIVEVRGRGELHAYDNSDEAIDAVLAGRQPQGEWIYLPGHPKHQPGART